MNMDTPQDATSETLICKFFTPQTHNDIYAEKTLELTKEEGFINGEEDIFDILGLRTRRFSKSP